MAPTATLDYRCSTCIINISENKCQCVENNITNNNDESVAIDSNKKFETIAKGQNVLNSALRSLRSNRLASATETADNNEKVLDDEKCRQIISLREVFEHGNFDDCWIVLYDRVYDVTEFLNQHPGGADVILENAGRDASVAFRGHSRFALMSLNLYEIGELPEEEQVYRRPGLLKCDEMPE